MEKQIVIKNIQATQTQFEVEYGAGVRGIPAFTGAMKFREDIAETLIAEADRRGGVTIYYDKATGMPSEYKSMGDTLCKSVVPLEVVKVGPASETFIGYAHSYSAAAKKAFDHAGVEYGPDEIYEQFVAKSQPTLNNGGGKSLSMEAYTINLVDVVRNII